MATRSSPPAWLRGPASLDDGWVTLDLERAREYRPMEQTELVYDLAAVSTPADVAAFVQRYGLLRHGPGADEHRERLSDFESEALTLRTTLRLYQALGRSLADEPKERVEGMGALRGELRPILSELFAAKASTDDEHVLQATKAIAMVVSEGLEGVALGVTAAFEWETGPGSGVSGSPGTFMFSPRPPDLRGYAWHQLAMAIVNRAPMRSCEECGRTFPVRDRRQRFCTPTCASRARYRRWSSKRQPDNREEK